MRKAVIILILLAIGALAAWSYFGGVEDYSAGRVEQELVQRGIPQPVAACMGERMAQRLSPLQLSKLGRMQAQEGESAVPASIDDFLARVRRIDDPEVVEVTVAAAAICAFTAR